MLLTVLGNNGPYPCAGGACSGYLLREKGIKILIDCGNGVLSNLQKFTGFEELDAVILTHLHSDHVSDMMILRYAIQIKASQGRFNRTIDVFAPSEPPEEYNRLDIRNVFNLRPVTADLVLNIGNITVTFCEMKHPVKCYGVSFDNGSKRFVFSGDTSWNENLIGFAKGCDLLMLDAGLLSKDRPDENVPHLTARECGVVAKKAGVKRLLLTHFWPEDDTAAHLAQAGENFENTDTAGLLCTYYVL